jgi:hypothetical protein
MGFLRPFLGLFLLLTVAACASNTPQTGPVVTDDRTTVIVENQSLYQVNMYAISGSMRQRIGAVPALGSSRLRIPASVVGLGRELQFRAEPVGPSSTATSYSIFVRPGEEVRITIPPFR